MAIRLAIIGFGKIAMDEHLPAITADPNFELVAVAGPGAGASRVRAFESHTAMLAGFLGNIDAVAICTPPMARYEIARDCLNSGLHVLLEKPPTVTLGEIDDLAQLAHNMDVSLFTAWHARFNRAVTAAGVLLANSTIQGLQIEWCEDVRQWHPGQSWIWRPGGFGVFDAAINAFSIATLVSPVPLIVAQAEFIVPSNMQTPIAASLAFGGLTDGSGATLDWRSTRPSTSLLRFQTQDATTELRDGGSTLYVDQKLLTEGTGKEYPKIYGRFAQMIQSRTCDVDREPLRVVADAFLIAQRIAGEPFFV